MMIIDNKQFRDSVIPTSNSFINNALTESHNKTFTFNLLRHNWRLLVNSAGQSFQTGTIISETNTPVSL